MSEFQGIDIKANPHILLTYYKGYFFYFAYYSFAIPDQQQQCCLNGGIGLYMTLYHKRLYTNLYIIPLSIADIFVIFSGFFRFRPLSTWNEIGTSWNTFGTTFTDFLIVFLTSYLAENQYSGVIFYADSNADASSLVTALL